MRNVIFAAMAGLMLVCPAVAQQREWRLTPEGYGPARIGMTQAQVSSALRVRLEGEALDDANSCIEMDAPAALPGVYFMFVDRRLSRISLTEPSRATTPRGIGIGATEAQVRRAYPRGLRRESHEYAGSPASYLTYWVRPEARGVRFETDTRRRVTTIHAGSDSITAVEGCA